MNVNRLGQKLLLTSDDTASYADSGDADNKKINANFKKGGFIGYQTFVHLMKCVQAKKNATEESEKNLYLPTCPRTAQAMAGRFVAFF